jgi:hypothetical protein
MVFASVFKGTLTRKSVSTKHTYRGMPYAFNMTANVFKNFLIVRLKATIFNIFVLSM